MKQTFSKRPRLQRRKAQHDGDQATVCGAVACTAVAFTLLTAALTPLPAGADGYESETCQIDEAARQTRAVEFSQGSAALPEEFEHEIRAAATQFTAADGTEMCLISVMPSGDAPSTRRLGRKRAEAVARRLMELGVDPETITIELADDSGSWMGGLLSRGTSGAGHVTIAFEPASSAVAQNPN